MRLLALALFALSVYPAIAPLAEPAISPDRKEIAFVSGGDIWTVPAAGGEARLLVSHAAYDSRPLYSPDGKRLAFLSTRNGSANIYVLEFATNQLQRLTYSDGNELLDNWSRNGEWIYFSSSAGDIAGHNDVYRVRVSGGTPQKVSADRYASEFHGAPTPDGKRLLFVARGFGALQWWRRGRSHLDESEIWILDEAAAVKDQQLLGRGAKQLWPQWMPDGKSFYFVSDRNGGHQNIHVYTMGKGERQVTAFTQGRVLFPNLSYDGKAVVFERDFGIWRLDTATGKAEQVPVSLRGTPSGPDLSVRVTVEGGYGGLDVSADGKKLAVTARGEVWAANAKESGDAFRVTRSTDADSGPQWAPDSSRLAYITDSDGSRHLMLYDFGTKETKALTSGEGVHTAPSWSPDGKKLAYVRNGEEIRVRTVEDGAEKTIYAGRVGRSGIGLAWSPDGVWIGTVLPGVKNFRNAWVLRADGTAKHQVSWLPNSFAGGLVWTPDGSSILYVTGQRTEHSQAAMVDLKPRQPAFREDSFRQLFEKGAADKKKPATEVVLEGIRDRVRLLPLGMDISEVAVSPDGKTLAFLGTLANQENLYTYVLDRDARPTPTPKQVTSTSTAKSALYWGSDNRTITYLDAGRVQTIDVNVRTPRPLAISAQLVERFDDTKLAVFRQAWMRMRDFFYDAKYHGADWNGEVKRIYGEAVAGARTTDEMRRVLNLMVGELNASHLGVSGPMGAPAATFGRLGLDWEEKDGKLQIVTVWPNGPAALAGGITAGDRIQSVNGTAVTAGVNLDSLLERSVGREVDLELAGGKKVRVRPIALAAEKMLRYNAWVAERRELVNQYSKGRLGYVHMYDMGDASLLRLSLDLDTEAHGKDGVVVDVRNNNGGYVNAYALDVLARKNYLNMEPRGFDRGPARASLGQRTIEKPTVLLTNQHSLSDAEDFSEGYRALGLGKIVGEPTAGWIIYTSNQPLLDGTMIRVPTVRVTTAKGEDMELHPRPVDIPVNRPMGESYRRTDIQLETAVKTLLGSL
ncbi:MAG TPA: S41 family peptidase [Bryobacteraceae bacterium]|nr:S41 family peptidase [Bryobacteraceae bacterium]